jgi:hypothetical protein
VIAWRTFCPAGDSARSSEIAARIAAKIDKRKIGMFV